jgi:AcrR family transcriptional regulator
VAQRISDRGRLSRAEIIECALVLAEEQGLEAVSLNKIADRVGVRTMSLYNHVKDKADVLDGMADTILAGFVPPDLDDIDFATGMKRLARAFRAAALRYPHAAPLVLTRRLNAPAAMPLAEGALALARRAGADPAAAVHVVRAFIAFLIGTMLREVGIVAPLAGDSPDATAAAESRLTGLGLPHIAASASELAVIDHEAEFEFGLDLLVSSVTARYGLPGTAHGS